MKLSIKEDASLKLEKIMEKVIESNPYAHKSIAALVEAMAFVFSEMGTPEQLEQITKKLTTAKGKHKAMAMALQRITSLADNETLLALEKTLKKFSVSIDKNEQKTE